MSGAGIFFADMSSTVIRALSVAALDLPLHAPFGISGGAQAAANNVLLTIELEDGTRGYGEAAPLPPYNGETQSGALAALRSTREWLGGRDARSWRRLAAEFRSHPLHSGSAQCALEMALLDALARHDGVPLWKYFGGAGAELETDMTVTTGAPGEAAEAARAIRARGIRIIKTKIGGTGGPGHDLARISAIHEVAPDSPLILDGNAGLSRDEAGELVAGLKRRGIAPALLEQWLAKTDLAGMRALHEESGWPVAADESVTTREEAEQVAAMGAAQVINIKLMKAGITAALEIVDVAREHRVGLMIGGNVESILAMTVSASFAAGLGGFAYADLDTPLFIASNPFDGGYRIDGGRISVAHITSGHGVHPAAAHDKEAPAVAGA